jgi:hypothetical protein
MTGLAQPADGLHPSEWFFDPLTVDGAWNHTPTPASSEFFSSLLDGNFARLTVGISDLISSC